MYSLPYNPKAMSDLYLSWLVTLFPEENGGRVNQRRDVSQEKPMTFRDDVRPRYSDPLCSRLGSFLGEPGNDTTTDHRALWQLRGEDYIINSPMRETIAFHGCAFLCKGTSRTINASYSIYRNSVYRERAWRWSDDKCVCTAITSLRVAP